MQFIEYQFLFIFLPVALVAHRISLYFSPKGKYGNAPRLTLFLLTLYFYGKKSPWWLIPFATSIFFDFVWASLIVRATTQRRKKAWLVCSIVTNLLLLGIFKYWDFALGNLARISFLTAPVTHLKESIHLSLPPGISFYTFESMSFVIDVYWGRIKPPKSVLEFFAFIGMFPRFIAGPIVRYRDIAHQFTSYNGMQWERGFNTFALGFFLKRCFADQFADWVPLAFGGSITSTTAAWLGVIAYSMQIYFDFWGYSLMAVGLGRILGFEFPMNFDKPYTSKSLKEFWTRWHISLSTWLRDYLYIPLGGNRNGEVATYKNLLITMLLGGLWHGANWTFLIWGAIHGGVLAFERAFQIQLGRLGTFCTVLFAWIFFKANNFGHACEVLQALAGFSSHPSPLSELLREFSAWNYILCITGLLYIGLESRSSAISQFWSQRVEPKVAWGLVLFALSIPLIDNPAAIPFLYFQF